MRLRKRSLPLLVMGFGVLASSTLVGIVVGCWLGEKRDPPSKAAVEVSGGGGATSPIEGFRDARYQNAIRGLAYESGFVEFANDWEDVLQESWLGEDVDTLLGRGAGQLQQNMVIKAIQAYTLAVLVDPQVPAGYQALGRAFVFKGKTDNAIAAYRTALRLDPNLIDTRYELGLSHSMQGDFQEAIDTWRQVLDRDPNHANTHERLAIALYYLGDYHASWPHVHAAEALGYQVPPQFRLLLEAQMAEP